jgi:hypothetical protein
MKFTKGLITSSLAFGLLVSGARAESPVIIEAKPIVVVHFQDSIKEIVVDDIVIDKGTGEEEVVDTEIKDDSFIYATGGGAVLRNLTSTSEPEITTDAGKDEAASAAKAAGVSAPAKSIASAGKRTSAAVKSGRVFLTH